jgi:hypothetical protein
MGTQTSGRRASARVGWPYEREHGVYGGESTGDVGNRPDVISVTSWSDLGGTRQ